MNKSVCNEKKYCNRVIIHSVNHQLFVYIALFYVEPPTGHDDSQLFVYPSFVYNLLSRTFSHFTVSKLQNYKIFWSSSLEVLLLTRKDQDDWIRQMWFFFQCRLVSAMKSNYMRFDSFQVRKVWIEVQFHTGKSE